MWCKKKDFRGHISYIQMTEEEWRHKPLLFNPRDIANLVIQLVVPDIESNPPGEH